MQNLKGYTKTIAAILLLGCVVTFFGRGCYEASYRSVISERDRAAGQSTSYTVPGGWAWFGLNLAVAGYGMVAWRYFGGWMTAAQVLVLCALGVVEINKIERQANDARCSVSGIAPDDFFPIISQRFALWGGLLGGAIASVGLGVLNLSVERRRWNSRHLLAAMGAVACLFGSLKIYEWQCREENRAFFAHMGMWPEGWQVTDEDRRMHEESVRKYGP